MKSIFGLWLFLLFFCASAYAQNLGDNYILEWKKFYPSQALNEGMRTSVFNYENRSEEAIAKWLKFNESILLELAKTDASIDAIDGRLVRVQAQSEVDKWKTLLEHTKSLGLYSDLISNALPTLLKADYLLGNEKSKLLCDRLQAITNLAEAARTNLEKVSKKDLEKGVSDLKETRDYLQKELKEKLEASGILKTCDDFDDNVLKAIQSIDALKAFGETTLQKNTNESEALLGRLEYNRRLAFYTDSNLTSKQLAEMALQEIQTVKGLMAEVSKEYISETYPGKNLPKNDLDIIEMALADMEKDAPLNATDYLQFWGTLADEAVEFIMEKDIATLPKNNTLKIQTAPESAGAAAQIGWVASAPPFDPNPMTTLNLPSIPETLPKQEQIDFWASFNKPFNRMIVIHELYPGHYMQLKISRETPHPIRLLFPYGIYIEGWATFTEKVLLDAGWEAGNHLTLLAHLRKRLENANRAYTSAQVHCNSWDENQVMQFSTETSLLAPQFAKSLWGRIMDSPIQITSYYLGGAQFTELLAVEKQRLGEQFDLKFFMDTIMKAGPIPIDEFYGIFENSKPNK